MYMYIFN